MDGIDLLASLRGKCRIGAAALMTGEGRPEDRARALSAGFGAFLVKPLPLADLLLTVRALLDPSRTDPPHSPTEAPNPSTPAADPGAEASCC